jgi:hypothetical protein
MLMVYPVVFSFSHVITHHLENHRHPAEYSCCAINHSAKTGITGIIGLSVDAPAEYCPIAEFEFPLGIPVNTTIVITGIFQLSSFQFAFFEQRCKTRKLSIFGRPSICYRRNRNRQGRSHKRACLVALWFGCCRWPDKCIARTCRCGWCY